MSISLTGFNANEVAPNTGGADRVPTGEYRVALTGAEKKVSGKGNEYLRCGFTVLEGPYEGRTIQTNLNLWHPDETTARIAQGDLSAICHAVGVMVPNDTDDLLNIPLVVRVEFIPKGTTNKKGVTSEYDENVIRAYKKAEAGASDAGNGQASSASSPSTTTTSPSSAPAPWNKRAA